MPSQDRAAPIERGEDDGLGRFEQPVPMLGEPTGFVLLPAGAAASEVAEHYAHRRRQRTLG